MEEKAIPESIVIKTSTLESFFLCSEKLALFISDLHRGKRNLRAFAEFKRFLIELYLKLGVKVIYRLNQKKNNFDKEDKKNIDILEKYLFETGYEIPNVGTWFKIYRIMQKALEDLGIYHYELPVHDPESAFKEGLK